ncbi:outer membrane lipoprotein-sorting protein [Burkholderia cenocepacia]|uniref:Outer membrane lipoprotein-sorting protein n=1 Tax=Burkholderia sola TaxID=2843302 RepID=A0ABV2C0Y4_9BURK|nr:MULTISPECIES: outer membrane lipoprotein-sorting protein [unclassified Burkholderia]RQU52197.1 outer membrane lipoprotein-sorting protein [Burkholderia cenocepacia]MBP0604862.1 outer membrane lipoprotein-sorting protein [Burkholderia sp. CpTa8-5]MBP0715431.1 outer membrane lipoprotein-sorting protein [Burkholderia sp. AcTa6-5]RQU77191.1 outer membrane lipoprotein-sorting protein [Burkholderia cenocepacia]RQV29801.1 outer membrane lipoprotein-sorting protein [Burkholderia cenocepacia]
MNRIRLTFAALVACVPLAAHAADTPTAQTMLARADAYRSTAADTQTNIRITNEVGGQAGDATRYLVYTRGNGDTLALTRSGENDGQKYLATTRGHWFYVPNTRSAVRINGMQRLQGEVVISDITRTHWADSYRATAVPGTTPIAGKPATELDLSATDPDNVYPTIKLWVTPDTDVPVRAQFFLASGLLFRSADFSAPVDANGRKVIRKITYRNEVEKQRASVVDILDGQPRTIPSGWFNPDTLADGQ